MYCLHPRVVTQVYETFIIYSVFFIMYTAFKMRMNSKDFVSQKLRFHELAIIAYEFEYVGFGIISKKEILIFLYFDLIMVDVEKN